MLKGHERFYTQNGKRLILIADDETVNREILGMILGDTYDIIFAEDGKEAMERIREHKTVLSLVMLDLMMPVTDGKEVLSVMRSDPELQKIPVIVLTADHEAEIESLNLGAVDFISKPYPQAGVILARVQRTIELSEDRQLLISTERDHLTGLYNKEFFYSFAEEYDRHHENEPMDAIVLDVCHFHIINDRFGTAFGDVILRQIGEKTREAVLKYDGIVCRKEADTFMIYCKSCENYKEILEAASSGIAEEGVDVSHVRLRLGVYANADKTLDVIRRFDRAKIACDMLRTNAAKNIEIYDDKIREKELYAERLINDFHTAIAERQFTVFYQPKFNIKRDPAVLSSAEALVRWKHPELGMISPGIFIPLFEDNGLIRELDMYVWEEAARQIREWYDKFGFYMPVSVNVSRIDFYGADLADHLVGLVKKNGLEPEMLLLEITESAYIDDSDQLVNSINELRERGFKIEMDDFGSGYSSLNMISALPIDVLKLDMKFIKTAFEEGNNTRMLEVTIDIAGYLAVPVVAEGVETEDQLNALRAIGCDMVQGYYFSKPVPPAEFEKFLVQHKALIDSEDSTYGENVKKEDGRKIGVTFSGIVNALVQDYFSIYYVDTETGWFIEYSSDSAYRSLGIEKSGADFFGVSRKNVERVVYEEDRNWLLSVFTRENILKELELNSTLTLTYRLVINAKPAYVRMKITRMPDKNDKHIVIGLTNVNTEMLRLHKD